ncbi:hypothetical protein [Thauera humireducens]|uniref:hypothetical protein n=1 Tax=Thauera humireducens TaxID=1134435 RepID=UPI00311EE2E4
MKKAFTAGELLFVGQIPRLSDQSPPGLDRLHSGFAVTLGGDLLHAVELGQGQCNAGDDAAAQRAQPCRERRRRWRRRTMGERA